MLYTTEQQFEMHNLLVELKTEMEKVAMEQGPLQWHRAHDKRHELLERMRPFLEPVPLWKVDVPVLEYLGKSPFPEGTRDFGQLNSSDPDERPSA